MSITNHGIVDKEIIVTFERNAFKNIKHLNIRFHIDYYNDVRNELKNINVIKTMLITIYKIK